MMAHQNSVAEIASSIRAGEITALDLVTQCFSHIDARDEQVNAFTRTLEQRAREKSFRIDQKIQRGIDPGPLAGVPFAVKNLFDIKDENTRAGARITESDAPATSDATLITRLEAAGAVLVGGLNMGEFAYDFTGENVHDGACRNPWDTDRMSGGSSSGSGAALAAGFVPLALGADTNGSIRVPSSLCGVMGLKPTYGRLPRTGAYPFCDSLDHVGPMARSVTDLALVYDVLQGYCPGDHACADRPVEPVGELQCDMRTISVGMAKGYFKVDGFEAVNRIMRSASAVCSTLGASVTHVDVPLAREGRSAAFLITNAESAALHRQHVIERADDFDPDTRDRFLAGSLLPAAWYVRAQALRQLYAKKVAALFKDIDVLIAPATPCYAPEIGSKILKVGGEELPLRPNLGYFTQPISCIGLPVCCVSVVDSGVLPMGLQVIAAPWREDLCLGVAAALEQAGFAGSEIAPAFVEQ